MFFYCFFLQKLFIDVLNDIKGKVLYDSFCHIGKFKLFVEKFLKLDDFCMDIKIKIMVFKATYTFFMKTQISDPYIINVFLRYYSFFKTVKIKKTKLKKVVK